MVKTLTKSIREYKKASVLAPVFVAFEVALECAIPLVMASLIDGMTGESMRPILLRGAVLTAMAIVSLICGILSARFAAIASCGYAKNLRHDLFYAVQRFSFADVDAFSSTSLVTRLTTDVTNVQNAYQTILRIAIRSPLMLAFAFAMSFALNARMALIFLVTVPVLGVALFLIIRKALPTFHRIFKKYDALNESVQENISGMRVVKSYVREEHEKQKFGRASADVRKHFTKAEKLLAWFDPIMTFATYGTLLLLSVLGARLIVSSGGQSMTTGELSSLITYATQLLFSLMMLSMAFVMITMALSSGKRISEVLEHIPSLDGAADGERVVADGSIEFDNVSFKYTATAESNVLENVTLRIESGETVGILGGTGASKTSLVQLIPRLYDVTEGTLKVGGKNVTEYAPDALRREVAVVLQKNVLFSGTVKENLRWGNPDATDEEMRRACLLAQADEFIARMPDGYDTYVERGGANVSGGQKQRLCIARALLCKAKILILDDSTSAVDMRTDALIRKALREELPDTTKIIIAQRVASVRDADKIVVMDGGKIVGCGAHDDLLRTCSIYREIYDMQTKTHGQEASA